MRACFSALAGLLAMIFIAAPAHACLGWMPTIPVFWPYQPLFTVQDDVVLLVKLKAYSEPISEDGSSFEFMTSCGTHRTGLVFDVIEVLGGDFDQQEIALVSNDNYFFDEPRLNETRILVGRVTHAFVGQRVIDDRREMDDLIAAGKFDWEEWEDRPPEARLLETIGPPSRMAVLLPTPPLELRLLFVFGRPEDWLIIGAALGALLAAFLGWRMRPWQKRPAP